MNRMKMTHEIKRLLKEVRPYKNYVVAIAITGIIFGMTYSRLALVIKDLFNNLTEGKPQKVFDTFPYAIGISLTAAICRYFHIYLMNYVSEMVVQNLRERLQSKFMKLSLTFHNNYSSGSGGLMSRVMNDVRVIQDGLRMIADFFLHPILFIFLIGNLFYLDYQLTLFVFLVLPIVATFLRSISKSLLKYLPRGQENLEKTTSIIKESLDGVRVIQSFGLESFMSNRLHQMGKEYLKNRKIIHSRIEAVGPVTEFLASSVILSVLLYTSYQIAAGKSTPGAFVGFITSLLMINQPLKKIQESYVRLQEVAVSTHRIFAILEEKSEVELPLHPKKFPMDWKEIEYRNVSFAYDKNRILDRVNIKIKKGEKIALVGSSGSGKSTIVNLLQRFYDPSEGEILIDGISILELDLSELRKNIALVSQDVFLLNDTIENNIRSGDFSKTNESVIPAAKAANADVFVSKLPSQYQSHVGERGGLLSGGEKQRISIARAFFKDSPILILDEATSALDAASETEVQKGLDHLVIGRTSLIITHRLSTIKNVDKIIVLKNGQVIETGTHDELVHNRQEYFNFLNHPNLIS